MHELARNGWLVSEAQKTHLELSGRGLHPDESLHDLWSAGVKTKYFNLVIPRRQSRKLPLQTNVNNLEETLPESEGSSRFVAALAAPSSAEASLIEATKQSAPAKRSLQNNESTAPSPSKRAKGCQEPGRAPTAFMSPTCRAKQLKFHSTREIPDSILREKVESMQQILDPTVTVMDCLHALSSARGNRDQAMIRLAERKDATIPSVNINRGGRPVGIKKVELRRPQLTGQYYSLSKECRDDTAWSIADPKRTAILTHVGRIEETDAGTMRNPACARCVDKGFACRIYTTAAAQLYAGKKGTEQLCSRCRYANKPRECITATF